jgi:Uma2 family endonuclease
LNIYIASANKIVHPDATVICGAPNFPKPNCLDNPMVVAEITSPATKDYDHGTKRELYFSLPSVQHYLLVSQTERKVGHFERSGARWIYMDHDSGSIPVGDAELPVGGIYADILV